MKFYKKLLAGISFWVALRRLNEVLQKALGWNFVLDRIWAARMGRIEAALGQASLWEAVWATFGRLWGDQKTREN